MSFFKFLDNIHNIKKDWVINDFAILEKLESGGFGTVYKVLERKTRTYFAIKQINLANFNKVESNKDEIVNHLIVNGCPFICKIHGIFLDRSQVYIVQDYCGSDLFNYIQKNNNISLDRKEKWIYQLLFAIACCHDRKIIHFDIKPENLVLDDQDNIKIIDFGSSRYEDNLFYLEKLGTSLYMAPELIYLYINKKLPNKFDIKKVDNWSIGIVIYFLLSNCPIPLQFKCKFPLGDSNDLTRFNRAIDYSIIPQHPKDYSILIKGLLNTDCEQRWSINEALNFLEADTDIFEDAHEEPEDSDSDSNFEDAHE